MAFPLSSNQNTVQLGSSKHQFCGDCVNYYSRLETCPVPPGAGLSLKKKAFDNTLGDMEEGKRET